MPGSLTARVGRRIARTGRVGARYGPLDRLMSALRKHWAIVTQPRAAIRFEGPVYCGPGFSLLVPGAGTFIVGSGVEFRRDFRAEIQGNGRIEIGAGSAFTYGTLLQCGSSITIGAHCGLGHSVSVIDGNHRFRDPDTPFLQQGYDFRPITIGDHVAVLSTATVIADVGDHAIVGANAVVTKPVPAYSVAVGVPARVREYFGPDEAPRTGIGESPG